MKSIKIVTLFTIVFLVFSCNEKSTKKENQSKTTAVANKIEVIDFHSTHRCETCKAIEANTKYTLDTYFSDKLKDNKITFQVINVDDEKNTALAEKFQASGTSLFLNVIKDGKEKQINLTDFAFMKGREKEDFSNELKAKIKTELEKM